MPHERVRQELCALLREIAEHAPTHSDIAIDTKDRPSDLPEALSRVARSLEPEHFGKYIMISPLKGDYVVAATASEVHLKFIEEFGARETGICLRIGASPFAAA